ncbi:MAG: ATP-binding cassette domain-containing protein [Bacilli bacterium]
MLQIKNVDKYFNKGKKNQLHVINNTNLTLEDTGLVALLGPSGCGKTTLLNAIGGLDKIRKGQIFINGLKISSKLAGKVDKIRNINVGYIFQDYKLIDNMSVYENVALVLTMIGIKDKKEIKKRVEYALDKVGMLRYKRRPAGMLSGGERQRVGIARAIVKDPNIILADEPTGNLDSKNSLEIMKIIKAISKDRLVILVTHEQSLAKFYASRIIEIEDGKVIDDYINDHTNDLDYEIDNTFYLKDFKEQTDIHNEGTKIEIYRNNNEKINVDIVIKNGNIYIKSNTQNKIEVIDDNSSIEFVNGHYKKIAASDINKYEFNFKDIISNNEKKKYSSILNPITLIIKGFTKVLDFPFIKKILLLGFFISALFITYSVSSVMGSLQIKDEKFVKTNRNYLFITSKKIDINKYNVLEQNPNINYIIPGNSNVSFNIKFNDYYQSNSFTGSLVGSLSDINMLTKKDIKYGRMPANDYEIIVDKMVLENQLKNNPQFMNIGIFKALDFIDRTVQIPNMSDFKIVGITDKISPSIYTSKNQFLNIIYNKEEKDNFDNGEVLKEKNVSDVNLYLDKIIHREGRMPVNDYEIIVNLSNKEQMPINKPISTKVNGVNLVVVGYYTSIYNITSNLSNANTCKYELLNTSSHIIVYPKDKDKVLDELTKEKYNIIDTYEKDRQTYVDAKKEGTKGTLIVSSIAVLISLVEILLMVRSSFLSRIKEIGIYRAIGVKKIDIYKMFFGEIFAITTLASLPGIILMSYILKTLSTISFMQEYFFINTPIIILTILFVYCFNLIVGLIPVFNVIRKRPAEILARTDVE